LLEHREVAEHARQVAGDAVGVASHVAAEAQVLGHGQLLEGAAPLGDVGDAGADDVRRGLPVDALAGQVDLAAGAHHHVAHRAQERRLAGAVGAQQRHHRALLDRQIDAVEDRHRPVARAHPAQLEQRGHAGAPPR
jgi:hypothetical protein